MNNKNLIDTLEALSNSVKETVDTVLKATKEGASTVVKKSETIVEISKLTTLLNTKTTELSNTLKKIGEVVSLKHESSIYIDPDLVEYASEATSLKNELFTINQQILKLRNKSQCSICGEYLDSESAFCPKCGAKQDCTNCKSEPCKEEPSHEESPTCINPKSECNNDDISEK